MRVALLLVSILVASFGRDAVAGDAPDGSVEASVSSVNEADLGRPYSATFAPVIGKEGRSMFPSAKKPRSSSVNEWRSDFIQVDSAEMLRANASAWAIGEGDFGSSSSKRYVVFRVRVVDHVLELDDATEQRAVDAESSAAYYLRKIYYGRMYEIVISGTRENLNARVVAGLEALGPKIGSSTAASRLNLTVAQKAKGLKPNGDAMFAKTVDEIKNAYKTDDMGPAVPILVEYRRIAGTKAAPREAIDWSAPANAADPVNVRFLKVAGNNSDWSSTGLTAAANDLIVGFANGKVDDGSFGGNSVEADNKGSGGLEMRVGGVVSAAGKSWALSKSSGEIKLRVRDTSFNDNKGAFDVVIVVVPGGWMKSADCQKQDSGGAFATCGP